MSFKYGPRKEVRANRMRFLRSLGARFDECVAMSVNDADSIRRVRVKQKGRGMRIPEDAVKADAFITDEKGVFLFLFTADCLPVAYLDPRTRAVGLAHLSFKSSRENLASKVVLRMREEFGTDVSELLVRIGPGVHKNSYVKKILDIPRSSRWKRFTDKVSSEEAKIDLIGYNREDLLAAGVRARHIHIDDIDTAATSGKYFSHRRSVRIGEPERRFATVIGIR